MLNEFLDEECLHQKLFEGKTYVICQKCRNKLHDLSRFQESQKNELKNHILKSNADHWHTAYNDECTKYLTLLEKVQGASCKLDSNKYDEYCSECVKGVKDSVKEIKYWQDADEHLMEKYFNTPRDVVDNAPRGDDGET